MAFMYLYTEKGKEEEERDRVARFSLAQRANFSRLSVANESRKMKMDNYQNKRAKPQLLGAKPLLNEPNFGEIFWLREKQSGHPGERMRETGKKRKGGQSTRPNLA